MSEGIQWGKHMTRRFKNMIYRLMGTQFSVWRALEMKSNADTVSMCSDDTMGEWHGEFLGVVRTTFRGLDEQTGMREGWCKQEWNQMYQLVLCRIVEHIR
jgi:hypothetical protein